MIRLIAIVLLLLPIMLDAQVIRSFTGTVTFGSFSTVNDSTFRGDITFNDQTNEYSATDLLVGDIAFTSSSRVYRVDAINSQTLFAANVDLVDIQDSNYSSPTGVGQISRKTGNYGFLTYTPDNANGYSQQSKSILETHNWNFLDSILVAGSNLAVADQTLTGNRSISGGSAYNLSMDLIPSLDIHVDEFFITDEATTVTDWLSTTNRYLKKNTGLMRINSLSQDFTVLQNTNGVNQLHFAWASDSELKLGSVQKEESGVVAFGSDITLTPTAATWSYEDSLSGVRGRILMNGSVIELSGTDTLVIGMSGVTVDNNIDTLLAISESGRVYKKSVVSVGGGVSYDDYASGIATAQVVRVGGTATTITNPSVGQYSFVVNSAGYVESIDFKGNNSNLDGLNQLTLVINNSTNSRDRLFNIQMIDLNSNSQVNAFVTGTNYTQSTFGNITTIVFSNMNGFSTPGYKILLR